MSWQAVRWAIHDAPVDDASELMVLIAICERADEHGRNAYPSVAWIADKARCSARTAHRHLRKLRKEGLVLDGDQSLVAEFRADRRPTVYDVDLERTRSRDVSPVTPRGVRQASPAPKPPAAPPAPAKTPHGVSPMTPRTPERGDAHDMSSVTGRAARGVKPGIHGVSPVADNRALPPSEVNPPLGAADAAAPGGHLFDVPSTTPGPVVPTAKPERIPPDFAARMTPQMRAWAATDAPLLSIDTETENFVDWWMSKGGPDAKKHDWVRTWKNWMRKEQKDAIRRSPRGRPVAINRSPDVPETF